MKSVILIFFGMLFSSASSAGDNVTALKMALDDEYKAKATYLKVIEDFGERRPFVNIVRSEQRHIEALLPFFERYGVETPKNNYLGNIPGYASFQDACSAGVLAEIDNVKLYSKIFAITDDPQLKKVFENLQWASQERHLPAFRRCSR